MKIKSNSYRQFCALARALDLVGDRWTLLVIRELLLGPRRFSDLLRGLPGIGPNLLSARLRRLEADGLVAREELAPPAASRVYTLTERGRGLDDALVALARWGMQPIAPPRPDDRRDPLWYALALRSAFKPDRMGAVQEDYELCIEGVTFHLRIQEGSADAHQGPAQDPVLVITVPTVDAFLEILTGERDPGPDEFSGDREALNRFLAAFELPPPTSVSDLEAQGGIRA